MTPSMHDAGGSPQIPSQLVQSLDQRAWLFEPHQLLQMPFSRRDLERRAAARGASTLRKRAVVHEAQSCWGPGYAEAGQWMSEGWARLDALEEPVSDSRRRSCDWCVCLVCLCGPR